MLGFLDSIFSGIGFTIFFLGVGYGAVSLLEAISKARKKRQERYDRLISAIEKVESEIRNQTNQR
jgi:hypothetical protein